MLHSRVIDYRPDDWATLTYEQAPVLRLGRLARGPADGRAAVLAARSCARERDERPLAGGGRTSTRRRSPRCAPPCASAAGRQPRLHDGDPQADRQLPRPQGQRRRAVLPVADRRGDGPPPRAVRARLRADRGGRPAALLRERARTPRRTTSLRRKHVAFEGLTRLTGGSVHAVPARCDRPSVSRVARGTRRRRRPDRGPRRGLDGPALGAGADARRIADARAPAASRAAGGRSTTTTTEEATFLAPLDPVSARGRAKPLFDFDYIWEVYTPAAEAQVRLLRAAGPVGRPARRPVRRQARPPDAGRCRSSACGSRTRRSRRDEAFHEAFAAAWPASAVPRCRASRREQRAPACDPATPRGLRV